MPKPPDPPLPAYLYTDEFLKFDYGPVHPLRIQRLGMTHELIQRLGLDQPPHPVTPASFDELCMYHDRRYLDTLKEVSGGCAALAGGCFGLGAGDNPVFKGMYDWSALLCGASLSAADLVVNQGHRTAFNMAGGMHHALVARAAGFCYVNDAAVMIAQLVKQGRRVLYLDLDAHHGDGVQWAFYDTPQVMTVSLHQHPDTLFPKTGGSQEIGKGEGEGYSVNLPLWPDTEDEIWWSCFDQVVPPLVEAFNPDYLVSQLGVDAFMGDPLANLNLTTHAYGRAVKAIRQMAQGRWIALGGGGYDVVNVARVWTLVWAIILGREDEVPEMLPAEFCEKYRIRKDEAHLLDPEMQLRGRSYTKAKQQAVEAVDFVKREIFPRLGI